jgi:hypothetical protein
MSLLLCSDAPSCSRHRLKITQQPVPIWYKDEGGRDKTINVSAVLVDEHDQAVRNRCVFSLFQPLFASIEN